MAYPAAGEGIATEVTESLAPANPAQQAAARKSFEERFVNRPIEAILNMETLEVPASKFLVVYLRSDRQISTTAGPFGRR